MSLGMIMNRRMGLCLVTVLMLVPTPVFELIGMCVVLLLEEVGGGCEIVKLGQHSFDL